MTERKTKFIVVMVSRRRAMKELGKFRFPPDTTSGGGSPRVSLRGPSERNLFNFSYNKKDEK